MLRSAVKCILRRTGIALHFGMGSLFSNRIHSSVSARPRNVTSKSVSQLGSDTVRPFSPDLDHSMMAQGYGSGRFYLLYYDYQWHSTDGCVFFFSEKGRPIFIVRLHYFFYSIVCNCRSQTKDDAHV